MLTAVNQDISFQNKSWVMHNTADTKYCKKTHRTKLIHALKKLLKKLSFKIYQLSDINHGYLPISFTRKPYKSHVCRKPITIFDSTKNNQYEF